VLFSEPKISQSSIRSSACITRSVKVSVLFSEPKISQSD